MNQQFKKRAFQPTDMLLRAGTMQTMAEAGVAASKDLYDRSTAAAAESTRAVTEIADTTWGSMKMLRELAARNTADNVEIAFAAAREMARATSLVEIGRIQAQFMQALVAQATEQATQFIDLSTRATQHLLEKAHDATVESFKAPL
jgi:hypothetical protein